MKKITTFIVFTMVSLFSIAGVTFPYTGNNDLNGVLSGQPTPLSALLGQWSMKTVAREASNIACDISVDSIVVNFVATSDPVCTPAGIPCDTSNFLYNNLITAGGAPCDDGTGCSVTDAGFTTFGIYSSEAYLLNLVQSGFDYTFDMCSGFGAGAWIPAITIVAPSGAIDAFSLGTSGTFATNCSLDWTATESGTYTIYIHEAGQPCNGGAQVDNGNPTVTCGTNAPTCLACTPGNITSPLSVNVCVGTSSTIVLDGTESTPGDYTIRFDDALGGTGGLAGGFTINGIPSFPWSFDNDVNGVLSSNSLDTLSGLWEITIINVDALGNFCDSISTTITANFLDSSDPLCSGATCSITAVTSGAQTACASATNTYTQEVTVTYSNAPATGMLNVNGQMFAIGTSPQTVTLTNLTANGMSVNVVASFSASAACTMTVNSLFTAATSCACVPFVITDIIVADTCGMNTGVVDLTISGGTGMIVHTWSNLSTNEDLMNVAAGVYNISISDAANCNEIFYYTVPSIGTPPTATTSSTDVTNCTPVNGAVSVTVTAGNPNYTYNWLNSSSVSISQMSSVSNLAAGAYSVTVTDSWGCTTTLNETVGSTTGLNFLLDGIPTDVTCFGNNDGIINTTVIGGSGSYSYTWTVNSSSITTTSEDRNDLIAGTYSVVVNDLATSCTHSIGPITINEPDELVATVTNSTDITCFGANNGSIDVDVVGGNGGNSFVWTNGGGSAQNASGLSSNSYVMTVTDSEGCDASTVSMIINEPSAIDIVVDNQNDVSCYGANDGNILVTSTGGTGGLTFDWNIAPNVEDAQNIGGGNYQLIVTDANFCTAQSAMITIVEPDELVVSIDGFTDESCYNANDGSISASVTGGTGAMNILWTNGGGTTLVPTGLAPNSYQLTVIDANLCSKTSTIVNIATATMLTATSSTTDETSAGSDGTATVVPSGGTPSYTYLWTPSGQTTAAAVGLSSGTYSCTIQDENLCTHTVTVEISKSVAIGEIDLTDLSIYPNPSNGTFTVQFGSIETMDVNISMYNTIGKEVFVKSFNNIKGDFLEIFKVDALSSGIYFLEISNTTAKSVHKITISK